MCTFCAYFRFTKISANIFAFSTHTHAREKETREMRSHVCVCACVHHTIPLSTLFAVLSISARTVYQQEMRLNCRNHLHNPLRNKTRVVRPYRKTHISSKNNTTIRANTGGGGLGEDPCRNVHATTHCRPRPWHQRAIKWQRKHSNATRPERNTHARTHTLRPFMCASMWSAHAIIPIYKLNNP